MSRKRKCAGPCGLDLPESAFALVSAHPPLPGARGFDMSKVIRVRRKTCRRCVGAALGRARDRANARRPRREIGSLVPCSCCGREKSWGLAEFRNHLGEPKQPCKKCHSRRVQAHRDTPKGRAAWRRYLRSGARAAARKRYDAKRGAQRARWAAKNPAARGAYIEFRRAVQKGLVRKPEKCPFCPSPRVSARFINGYDHPLDVAFACQKCHAGMRGLKSLDEFDERRREAAAARAARKYRIPLEVADRLTVTPEEWRRHYAAALAEARRDAWPVDRFGHPVVEPGQVHVDASPRPRPVDRWLLMAMGYEA